jgi:hypothetical protein
MDLEIDISQLREITNRIFDHIEKDLKITGVRIDKDYYWDIPDKDLYDPSKDPGKLVFGQLYDDWSFLLPILSDKELAVSIMLIHVASLLRYIGNKVGQ